MCGYAESCICVSMGWLSGGCVELLSGCVVDA